MLLAHIVAHIVEFELGWLTLVAQIFKFAVERQVELPIQYDGIIFDEGLRLDVLINRRIICELKAVDTVNPIWQAQLLSHLKLTGLHVGFINQF